MDRSEVAIIIPAYNEETSIGRVVQNTLQYGNVIVVNDCSKDKTAEIAEKSGAIVISHSVNKGYDGALNSGFAKANELDCKYAITFDADGQHDSKLIKCFLDFFENGTELVLGMRSKPARLMEYIFGIYTSLRFGIKDPLCGMKAYCMSIYRRKGAFDTYQSIGTELALWAAKNNAKVIQKPIPIYNREGVPRFGRLLNANLKIFRAMLLSFVKI